MKNQLMATFLGIFFASTSYATGSLNCVGQTSNGTKVQVMTCVSHSDASVCDDVSIYLDDTLYVKIPAAQAKTGERVSLSAADDFGRSVSIVKGIFGSQKIIAVVDGEKYTVKKASCDEL